MEDDYKEESEGIINTPKVMNLTSNKAQHNYLNLEQYKKVSHSSKNIKLFKLDTDNNKIKTEIKIKKSKFKKLSSSISPQKQKKRVSFSSVQVVRVKNYKKYNKINTSPKKDNIDTDSYNCILF